MAPPQMISYLDILQPASGIGFTLLSVSECDNRGSMTKILQLK